MLPVGLGLLPEPEPFADLRHEAGHGATLRPFGRFANRSAETLLGTVDTSWEERQQDKGMALTFIPSDLIDQAAREENELELHRPPQQAPERRPADDERRRNPGKATADREPDVVHARMEMRATCPDQLASVAASPPVIDRYC